MNDILIVSLNYTSTSINMEFVCSCCEDFKGILFFNNSFYIISPRESYIKGEKVLLQYSPRFI